MLYDNHDIYGPAAKFSEHKPGEIVRYYLGQEIRRGEILYVQAPEQVGSTHHPLTYVVDSEHGFPDFIYATDILEPLDDQAQEPTLIACPYCTGMHMSDQVELCPLKPRGY